MPPNRSLPFAQWKDVVAHKLSPVASHPGHKRRLAGTGIPRESDTAPFQRDRARMQRLKACLQQKECADRPAQDFFDLSFREAREQMAFHLGCPRVQIECSSVHPHKAVPAGALNLPVAPVDAPSTVPGSSEKPRRRGERLGRHKGIADMEALSGKPQRRGKSRNLGICSLHWPPLYRSGRKESIRKSGLHTNGLEWKSWKTGTTRIRSGAKVSSGGMPSRV